MPAIREGNRNPLGLELLSAAAERGNYPEAKPNRDGLKGRRACKEAELYRSLIPTPMTERSSSRIGASRIADWQQNDGQRVRHTRDSQKLWQSHQAESERTCVIQIDSCGLPWRWIRRSLCVFVQRP